MTLKDTSIVEQLALDAVRRGAEAIEIEYKDGHEQVCAVKGGIGFGIGRFPSSSPEAKSLRNELYLVTKRKRRVVILDGHEYEMRGHVFDSFGEDGFHIELRRVHAPTPGRAG